MSKPEKTTFTNDLLNWFAGNKRALPWRENRDIYRVWVSEVMLQQTRVDTVIPYFHRFMTRFPSVAELAAADQQDVLKIWEGLGYYGRARNLHRAAGIVMAEHAGVIPTDPAAFRKLPGVGDYIGAAVMSIACGHPLPVVDGNVLRVAARLFGITDDIARPATRKTVRELLQTHIPHDAPGDFNEAMMELGATICTPTAPACSDCPVQHHCVAFREHRTCELPVKTRRGPVPEHRIVVAVITDESGRILVQQRPENGLLGGLWEFPGGKVETGETVEAALARECREELGITVAVGPEIATIRHAYTHFKIHLTAFHCTIAAGTPASDQPLRWLLPDQLTALPFPKANHKLFPNIMNKLV